MSTQPTIKNFFVTAFPAVLAIFIIFFIVMPKVRKERQPKPPAPVMTVNSFQECVEAGNPVMESYPRQCRHEDRLFAEEIATDPELSEVTALEMARDAEECTGVGEPEETGSYNPNSRTWWFNLVREEEVDTDGCAPACVVWEETGEIEVNWRCTGLRQ